LPSLVAHFYFAKSTGASTHVRYTMEENELS